MTSFTNHTPGPKGINLKDGKGTRWIEPGETVEIDDANIAGDVPDLGKAPSDDDALATDLATANATIVTLKARIAELEASAAKPKLPGLTGKGKAALLQIASDEGVVTFTADDGAEKPIADGTNNDIVAAIEAKREPAA